MDAGERLKSRLREPLRLGLWLDFRPAPGTRSSGSLYGEILKLASLAESSGFSAVFTTEHHGSTDGYLSALRLRRESRTAAAGPPTSATCAAGSRAAP